MSTKSLLTGAALAVSCVLSAGAAFAQAPYNPWYMPARAYVAAPVYGPTPYCPNGNCAVPRTSYYAPALANCPNGNCGSFANCANGQCAPANCANGQCFPKRYGPTSPYAPVYPTQPTYYRSAPVPSYTVPSSNWSTPNYRPAYDPWASSSAPRSTRMYNSANSPFYP